MSGIFGLIQLMLVCGTLLGIAFMVCLALPQSPFKDFVLKVSGWGLAIVCGIYCISPVDIIPEAAFGPLGLVDDVFSLILAIFAAKQAKKVGESSGPSHV